MKQADKLEIHKAFVEAINKEDLHTRQAAAFLNVNPLYVTYMKSPKYYEGVSADAMNRFEEWFNSRAPISQFQVPDGEEILASKESVPRTRKEKKPALTNDDLAEPAYGARTEKPGKSVKLVLYQGEIDALNKRIDLLIKDNNEKAVQLDNTCTNLALMLQENIDLKEKLQRFGNELFVLQDESIPYIRQQIEDLQTSISHLVTLPKPEGKAQIVFFQRNTYKS